MKIITGFKYICAFLSVLTNILFVYAFTNFSVMAIENSPETSQIQENNQVQQTTQESNNSSNSTQENNNSNSNNNNNTEEKADSNNSTTQNNNDTNDSKPKEEIKKKNVKSKQSKTVKKEVTKVDKNESEKKAEESSNKENTSSDNKIILPEVLPEEITSPENLVDSSMQSEGHFVNIIKGITSWVLIVVGIIIIIWVILGNRRVNGGSDSHVHGKHDVNSQRKRFKSYHKNIRRK